MIHKARENLESARILAGYKMADAVANRAYYAVYQAGWYYLDVSGHPVPEGDGKRYWPHDRILHAIEDAAMQGGWEVDFDQLQQHRVKADYRPDSVPHRHIDDIINKATRIVQWVIENDPTAA